MSKRNRWTFEYMTKKHRKLRIGLDGRRYVLQLLDQRHLNTEEHTKNKKEF